MSLPPVDPNNPFGNPTGPGSQPWTAPNAAQSAQIAANRVPGSTPDGVAAINERNENSFNDYNAPTGAGGTPNWSPTGGLGADGFARANGPAPTNGTPMIAAQGMPNYFKAVEALPGDFNLQWGGPGEQFYAATQGQYVQPGASEATAASFIPRLTGQGRGEAGAYAAIPGMTANGAGEQFFARNGATGMQHAGGQNMGAQVFADWQRTAGQDPGLGAYYDNAGRQAMEKINQNAAARGTYGSSAAIGEGTEALTNLAADRAKNEANYNLDRLRTGSEIGLGAEKSQGDWFKTTGDQAFRADEADLARQLSGAKMGLDADRVGLDRAMTAGGLASDADSAWMNRLTSGQNAASGAQSDREGRIQTLFDAVFGANKEISDTYQDYWNQSTGDSLDLLTQANNASLAGPSTALNYDTYEANQHRTEINDGLNLATMGQGGGIGGGGGGGP